MKLSNNVTAAVLMPDATAAFEKVYGLTILERTLHALERGGIAAVFLPKEHEAKVAAVVGRRKDWKLDIRFVPNFKAALLDNNSGILLLSEPMVLDPKVPQILIERGHFRNTALVHAGNRIAFLPPNVVSKITELPTGGSNMTDWLRGMDMAWEAEQMPGLICEAIHHPDDKKAVKRALIRNLTKPTDGWVSKNLNRPVSTSISRVLAHTPITPNQFTIITGIVGIATGFFLAKGGYWYYLIGGFLFHFTSVLDGVDGELARLKFKSSPFGQWLDTVVDNLSYLAALGGMITGLVMNGATHAVQVAGMLAVVGVLLALGSLYLYLLRFNAGGTLLNVKYGFQDGDGWFNRVMLYAAAFGKRDFFALVFFALAIVGQLPMALGYIAIMAFFVFGFSLQAHFQASKQRV